MSLCLKNAAGKGYVIYVTQKYEAMGLIFILYKFPLLK